MPIIAKTSEGELEGRDKEGALLFGGIPYAAPPTGVRRFAKPERHDGWTGVRSATRFGPAAPQLPGEGLTALQKVRWDEDCLFLNVTTPALDDEARPVMVWIHGGAFVTGQGAIPWYNGASFATRGDIVTVSINYRLGALGFTHLPEVGGADFASSGLCGILDQIAALQWVKRNIAAFGGDPERVTIAGESAGGMSVGTLLGCPEAQGLFRAAIPQSGAAQHVISDENARMIGCRLADELGCSDIQAMQRKSADEILAAQRDVQAALTAEFGGASNADGLGGMSFRPVLDGAVLPQAPIDAIASGIARDVQIMTGSNLDETTLWGYGSVDEARLQKLAPRFLGERAAEGIETYRRTRPDASPAQLLVALTTDEMFRMPAIRLAEAQRAAGGDVWMYLFSWASRAYGGKLGATHSLEIPFAFDNLTRAGVDAFLGKGPIPQDLADRMHGAWTSFIRGGDPNGAELPEWPGYEPQRRATLEWNDALHVLDDPFGEERRVWDDIA
jgi:para-nitrobenzyl esterase